MSCTDWCIYSMHKNWYVNSVPRTQHDPTTPGTGSSRTTPDTPPGYVKRTQLKMAHSNSWLKLWFSSSQTVSLPEAVFIVFNQPGHPDANLTLLPSCHFLPRLSWRGARVQHLLLSITNICIVEWEQNEILGKICVKCDSSWCCMSFKQKKRPKSRVGSS